jgi:hypothetical protein
VAGKSLAIMSRTGHVWHPIGKPKGFACSFSTPDDTKPTVAADVVTVLQNSLLEISDIAVSLSAGCAL